MQKNRKTIAESFAALKGRGIGLVPFLPAGYPDLETTANTLVAIDAAGPAAIEIGFPFSDPIADGTTIQAAFTAALSHGIKVAEVFSMIRKVSGQISAPLVGMLSYSIVYRFGPEKFFADANNAGLDGLIIPDLPPPEAEKVCSQVRAAGLDTILLVAPTTMPDRRREIVRLCSGFVYYLSVSGITGARDELPPDLADNVKSLRSMTDLPVCVGFGISHPKHIVALSKLADGAVVGSAIVKRMTDLLPDKRSEIPQSIGEYCQSLVSAR
jgi:tryptophan synthase alpha chain